MTSSPSGNYIHPKRRQLLQTNCEYHALNSHYIKSSHWTKRIALITLHKVTSGFNRSMNTRRQLEIKRAERGFLFHQLINNQSTRWGTTYDMFKQFLETVCTLCYAGQQQVVPWATRVNIPNRTSINAALCMCSICIL